MAKTLEIDSNKGLLFPVKGGKVTGAVRVEGVYYEVSNSSTTVEGTDMTKTLNVSLKKLGGRKAFDIHITRSKFKGEKDPQFISNNFMIDGVEHQVVGWHHTGKVSGRALISLAVNEVSHAEFDL